MQDDPTIARIRQARHAISEKCGHDARKLVEYYIEMQQKHKDRFTNPSQLKREPEDSLTKI